MLMIERVVFYRDDSTGTTATLTLVDPQAYGGQGVGGGESAPIWDVFGGDGQSGAAAP